VHASVDCALNCRLESRERRKAIERRHI